MCTVMIILNKISTGKLGIPPKMGGAPTTCFEDLIELGKFDQAIELVISMLGVRDVVISCATYLQDTLSPADP
jgi:hypothetical protein